MQFWCTVGVPERSAGDGAGGEFTRPEREKPDGAAAKLADRQKQTQRSLQTRNGPQRSEPRARLLVRRGREWPSSQVVGPAEPTEAPGTPAGEIDGQPRLQTAADAVADATSEVTARRRVRYGTLAQKCSQERQRAAAVARVRLRADLLSLAGTHFVHGKI